METDPAIPHEPPDSRFSALAGEQARLLYAAAQPLWIDAEVFQFLFPRPETASEAMQLLERHLLLTRVSGKRAVIRPAARRQLLRAGLRGGLPDHRALHADLANLCTRKLDGPMAPPAQLRWARALAYHLFAAADPGRWPWLSRLFDDAEARNLVESAAYLLEPIGELRPVLSLEDRVALSYYRARVALLRGESRHAERLLRAAIACRTPASVVGLAHRALGRSLARRERWSEGLAALRRAEATLAQASEQFSLAITRARIGELYLEWADFNGGIIRTRSLFYGDPAFRVSRRIIYFPALANRWLSLQIQRLPFLDIGFRYQNWVTARVLLAAVHQLTRAERILREFDSPQASYEVQLSLARAYTQLGMWRRANRQLGELERSSYVQESEYRTATIRYWRAEILLQQGIGHTQAFAILHQVASVYETFQQHYGLAVVYERLGDLTGAEGDLEAAQGWYLRAARHYAATDRPLARTAVQNQVKTLTGDALPFEESQYAARFPDRLARFYRWISFATLGLLIALGLALIIFGFGLIFEAENNFLLGTIGATAIILLLSWPLVAIWIFQIIYLAIGLLVAYTLPIRALERDPPVRYKLDPEKFTISGGRAHARTAIPWREIRTIQSIEFQLYRRPIELISSLDLLGMGRRIRIPGLTTGYNQLKQELRQRYSEPDWQSHVYSLIPSTRYYAGTLVAAVIFGTLFQSIFEIGGVADIRRPENWQLTNISGLLLGFLIGLLIIFPLASFWRLVIHRARIRRATPPGIPKPAVGIGTVLIYLGTAAWSLIAIALAFFMATLGFS